MATVTPEDDKLIFSDDTTDEYLQAPSEVQRYKLLIVDDEKEVHVMTKLVLSDYSYKGSTLEFFSAYSMEEAKKMIKEHPDAACILLDVVMETRDAGLELARFIREKEKNEDIRIILRTGQPGQAPEKDIILNYDINDYKEKTELTTQKLFTTITTALRSFIHLVELNEKRKEINEKNIQLNEEIAKRIVAEHNLKKYNRSLEKILDSKTERLRASLKELKLKEEELQKANILSSIGDVSSVKLDNIDMSQKSIKTNLDTMNVYRSEMTLLLEKYELLQDIFHTDTNSKPALPENAKKNIEELDQFKQDIDIDTILAKYPEIIKDAIKGIESISVAVNDIKLFVSIDEEPKKQIDINLLLGKCADSIKRKFGDNIDLQTDFSNLPQVLIAKKNIAQAFYEIVLNAFEATATKEKGFISIVSNYEDPDIIIQISDTGPGIDEKDINRIFRAYFTRKDARGLGLSFAQASIKNHRGTITATSKPGEGATIIVTLPAPNAKD